MTTDESHSPYNSRNRVITENEIKKILRKYGVKKQITSTAIFERAFVHKSYTYKEISADQPPPKPGGRNIALRHKSNERLEFLGDGVLELATKYYLYRRFPDADEGFMTEKKIALVKNEHIGHLAKCIGLDKWYIMSKSAEEKNNRSNLKKLGCLFEAWLGALFLDYASGSGEEGFAAAKTFVESVYEQHVDWEKLITTDDNYKNILQVKLQKTFKTTPDYVEVSHSKDIGYEMAVYLALGKPIYKWDLKSARRFVDFGSLSAIQRSFYEHGTILVHLSQSRHRIKKKAEQHACLLALRLIGDEPGS